MSADRPNGADDGGQPPGRPNVTTRDELAGAALELFLRRGFDETSVDEVAAAAGVSRRTFFRYFPTKSAVLWHELDAEIEWLRQLLTDADDEQSIMDAVRSAVHVINLARPDGARELRSRMTLIGQVPSLQGVAAVHYEAWIAVIGDFVARRVGVREQSLVPLVVGRSVLAAATAAYETWVERGDRSLVAYLDEALAALATGFDDDALRARVQSRPFTGRARKRAG